jgi:hypothetical protein
MNNVPFFPSFSCYDSKNWEAALRNPRDAQLLNVRVYNGRMGPNGRIVDAAQLLPNDPALIADWLGRIIGQQAPVPPAAAAYTNPYMANCRSVQYVGSPHR